MCTSYRLDNLMRVLQLSTLQVITDFDGKAPQIPPNVPLTSTAYRRVPSSKQSVLEPLPHKLLAQLPQSLRLELVARPGTNLDWWHDSTIHKVTSVVI